MLHLAGNWRNAFNSLPSKKSLRSGNSLFYRHDIQLTVLFPLVIEMAGKEIEHRVHSKLVKKRIRAIVRLAHLNWIITCSASYSKYTQATEQRSANQHRCKILYGVREHLPF